MNVVLDTNVVVSAAFFGGTPFDVFAAWHEGRFDLVATKAILQEYRRVLAEMGEEHGLAIANRMYRALAVNIVIVPGFTPPASLCRDPDDDKFLACAAVAGAVLVSGDRDLLAIDGALGVSVLTPRAFLAMLRSRG